MAYLDYGGLSHFKNKIASNIGEITAKLTKYESNNFIKSDSEMTVGYIGKNGQVYSYTSYQYTPKIPVSEGDVVRVYGVSGGGFQSQTIRELCAYNAEQSPVSSAGGENYSSYTVPSGISYVVATIPSNATSVMVTKNYVATAYEEYFEPYYVASEDFVEDVLNDWQIPEDVVDGYNLYKAYEYGVGYYEVAYGQPTFYNYSSYRYAIIPVDPNSIYYWSYRPVAYILVDADGNVVKYGNMSHGYPGFFIETDTAVKLYYTINSSYDSEVIISKGTNGAFSTLKKPSFLSEITQRMQGNNYGCALPKVAPRLTVGMDEVWYKDNILAIPSDKVNILLYQRGKMTNDGFAVAPRTVSSSTNGYGYYVFDPNMHLIDIHKSSSVYTYADSLESCSALVIGDSTVAQNVMTQRMLDAFTSRSKTLTLLGTRGTSPNNHEGRAGWTAKQYCTVASSGSVTNAFFNPTTEKFDFSYYMSEQGYSAPDFVVVQLGINDLYNTTISDFETKKAETANYVMEIIESILAYNANQKILLNLPTAVNSDQSKHTVFLPTLRNMFIRYNEYMLLMSTKYGGTKVRCSYTNLILNPAEDIRDDVHPTDAGYEKMANEVVSQINCWQQE